MTFLDVSEVPEHDKAKKKFVSVCLWICISVYLYICISVSTITPLRKLLQSSFWCQNLRNSNTVNWKAFELCSVTETLHASPKRHNFDEVFQFFSIFSLLITFKWIDMNITFEGLINTHRMMWHMFRVNQSVTSQVTSKVSKCLFLTVFHNFLIFDDTLADWHENKFCRSCRYALNGVSHLWGQTISDTAGAVKRVKIALF
jgi:hypothetical protein